MEYMNFIHWCINQYIVMANRVKNSIYRKNGQYTPALLDITLAQKCIFLTALINDLPLVRGDNGIVYDQINQGLIASYEKIKGTWKGKNKECINTSRLYVRESFSGDLFFLQLMIAADDLYYGGDLENNTWVEQNMIDLPVDRELSLNRHARLKDGYKRGGLVDRELGENGGGKRISAKDFLSKFIKIIDKEKDIFYMRDEFGVESQWFDYMKIYNFYEHYWYLAEYEFV